MKKPEIPQTNLRPATGRYPTPRILADAELRGAESFLWASTRDADRVIHTLTVCPDFFYSTIPQMGTFPRKGNLRREAL